MDHVWKHGVTSFYAAAPIYQAVGGPCRRRRNLKVEHFPPFMDHLRAAPLDGRENETNCWPPSGWHLSSSYRRFNVAEICKSFDAQGEMQFRNQEGPLSLSYFLPLFSYLLRVS